VENGVARSDVLIIGAGPTGLVLALWLTKLGAKVRIVDGSKIPYYDQSAWAAIATLNGLPATTMPNGRSESGLPIGVQIIGGYLEDRSTIAFAGLIEREFGGFTPPPI
jgi:Asp-tRNA(Asn)/Glu-tRNA(Gln) amidotransferase A subunit family amidase